MRNSSQETLGSGVSIIICSYNGGDKLKPTLQHIAAQDNIPENCLVEIIYVDNASTDNSREIVQDTWAAIAPPHISLKILQEEKAGKYFAFQTAIAHASYRYFIICDDDNWLSPDYVGKAYTLLNKDEAIGAVGGRTVAAFERADTSIPEWFDSDRKQYAIGKQGEESGDVSKRKQLWGAGLASRTEAYRLFYEKYPSFFLSCEEDKGQLVAEDTEYCLRLLLRGYKLFYEDSLVLQHFVPDGRLTLEYNKKLKGRIESSLDVIERYNLATKCYGRLVYSPLNLIRLKLFTPILLSFAKTPKKKRRHQLLTKLLFPSKSAKDPVMEDIRRFATDPDLPGSAVK